MKVKVLKPFADKANNLKKRKVGDQFEITKERFQEINGTKHGVLVEEIKAKKNDGILWCK